MDIKGKVRRLLNGDQTKDATEIPTCGWPRVGLVLRQFWAEMIGVNVLFILCCLPLVTIPAAWCGLHRVILNRVRARHEPVLSSFFKEFMTDFPKRTLMGLLLLVAPFSLSFYVWRLGSETGWRAMALICGLIVFVICHYLYPLLVLLDVPPLANLKNACSMALLEWRTTLIMLGTAGVIDLAVLIFTLSALPLVILFLPAFNCLVCCAFFNGVFPKYFEKDPEMAVKFQHEETE